MNLKQQSFKAVTWDMLGTVSTKGVSFIISIVLARLLSPSEFGLIGMTMVFISISNIVVNFGFSSALIQQKTNTSTTYSSVFFVNIAIGLVIFCALHLTASGIAHFYEEPEIKSIVKWLALSVLFQSFNVVQVAILQRNLRFKELSIRQFSAAILSGIVGIILALNNFGVYALVFQNIMAGLVSTVLLWRISGWTPQFVFSKLEIKKLWSFGAYLFMSGILYETMKRVDVLIIGKLFSAATLGFFSRAESLNQQVTTYASATLKKVFFPVLSKLQDDPTRFEKVYLKVLEIAAFGVFLLSGCLILSGDYIIITLFGEKWKPSIFIFQILMLKVFTTPISSIVLNAFLATGKSKQIFWYNHVTRIFRVAGWAVAYFYGFETYLYALVMVHLLSAIYYNFIVSYSIKISFKKQLIHIYSSAGLFVSALLPSWWLKTGLYQTFLHTTLLVLLFSAIYLILAWLFKRNFLNQLLEDVYPYWVSAISKIKHKLN